MKIKVDFVTNSSSEVFGVVLADSATVAGLLAFLGILLSGCKEVSEAPPDEEGSSAPENETPDVLDEAETMAKKIANAALEDAKKQEQIVKDAYSEAQNALDSAKTALQNELDETQKTWAESEKTIDKSDPGYADFKKQYDDYMDYLKTQMDQTDYQKQMIEYDKAQKQAEMDSKTEWVKQRQADYIAVKEETALLQAVAKGYNVPGYNTDSVNDRLKQLAEREKDLGKVLSDNNANIDYTAQDRGSIGPSKESEELNNKIRAEKEKLEKEKENASAAKRAQLEDEMNKNIEEYKKQMKTADRFDMATKAAEGVQFGADMAVEGLSYVTGPAGQQIKLAYTAGKGIASGIGEGMADPKKRCKAPCKRYLECRDGGSKG